MFTFGDPIYNETENMFEANLVQVDPEDTWDYQVQEIESRLSQKAIGTDNVIEKMYEFLYIGKGIEMHINRVRPSLIAMIESVTYKDLVEMKVISIEDIK
jgi:hypothetical protein